MYGRMELYREGEAEVTGGGKVEEKAFAAFYPGE